MSNIVNRINEDTHIFSCKKRAKEIFKNQNNGNLPINQPMTLMQCLEIAANEMHYNSWYELRTKVKKNLLNNSQATANKEKNSKTEFNNHIGISKPDWENFIMKFFNNNYETIHIEARDSDIKIKGRKFGLLEELEHNFSFNDMELMKQQLSINPSDYDWLSKEKYNVQSMPVYSIKGNFNNYYDIIFVKKDNFEIIAQKELLEEIIPKGDLIIGGIKGSGMAYTLKNLSKEILNKEKEQSTVISNTTFSEKLSSIGFNKNNIHDMTKKFGNNSIFIAGTTGSGKSKTAQIFIEELKRKKYYVREVAENTKDEKLNNYVLILLKSNPDYIFFPEIRSKETARLIKKVIESGVNVITTLHANGIDAIYPRVQQFEHDIFKYVEKDMNLCFIYQKLESILCPSCKEKSFSFKKVLQNEIFRNYVNKYEKHNEAENNMYKRGSSINCNGENCHQGLIGRRVIAETFVINLKDKEENKDKYIRYHKMSEEEKTLTNSSERFNNTEKSISQTGFLG